MSDLGDWAGVVSAALTAVTLYVALEVHQIERKHAILDRVETAYYELLAYLSEGQATADALVDVLAGPWPGLEVVEIGGECFGSIRGVPWPTWDWRFRRPLISRKHPLSKALRRSESATCALLNVATILHEEARNPSNPGKFSPQNLHAVIDGIIEANEALADLGDAIVELRSQKSRFPELET